MNEEARQPGCNIEAPEEWHSPSPSLGHVGAEAPVSGRPRHTASPKTDSVPATHGVFRTLKISRVLVAAAVLSGSAILLLIAWSCTFSLRADLLVGMALLALAALGLLQQMQVRAVQRLTEAYHRAQRLADVNSSIIASFAMAIDAKDQHTHGHTQRVCEIAAMIAEEMRLTPDELQALRTAAMLHDIGKLAVPDHILSKPAQLTQDEMRKVQTHTLVGAALLGSVNFPWPVVPIIRSHHEWYDGTGYPEGLAADQIPLGARILAVADVYDALLSHRPYRPPMAAQEAVAFMRERMGKQFDPEILGICLRVLSTQLSRKRLGCIYDANAVPSPQAAEDATDQHAIFMDIQQAHQELLSLYEIVQTMGQSLNMQETADLIISKTKRIIDFATCVLFLLQPDDNQLVAVAASGPYAEAIHGRRLALGSGVSGAVALNGTPSGTGRPASADLTLLLGPSARECSLTEVLSAPLVGDAGTVGTLTLYRSSERPFTADDARLVATVARQATIAISNARKYEQTRQSALTDELTGLANARFFFIHLEEELSRARHERIPLSLIAIDLNNLKSINDTFGHQQGDRVLRILAEVFRRHVRDSDTVVRYAGDEFFIILPNTTNKLALDTVNRIKRAVRETTVEMLPGRLIGLSASLGVATFPGDARDAQSLIAVADRAMYADKRLDQQTEMLSQQ
ncbi:MAG TPA: HD domain-containing phosphohydrolase, partial [Anaerolineae bacterium]|nr:HD domain-containing phosphohydrolase [Anaerolineae bacterium]